MLTHDGRWLSISNERWVGWTISPLISQLSWNQENIHPVFQKASSKTPKPPQFLVNLRTREPCRQDTTVTEKKHQRLTGAGLRLASGHLFGQACFPCPLKWRWFLVWQGLRWCLIKINVKTFSLFYNFLFSFSNQKSGPLHHLPLDICWAKGNVKKEGKG